MPGGEPNIRDEVRKLRREVDAMHERHAVEDVAIGTVEERKRFVEAIKRNAVFAKHITRVFWIVVSTCVVTFAAWVVRMFQAHPKE